MLPPDLNNIVDEFANNAGHPFKKTLAVLQFVADNRDAYTLRNVSRRGRGDSFDELTPWMKYVVVTNLEVIHRMRLTLRYNPRRYYKSSWVGEIPWIHT